ncbi:concanavalin A-like lectin/glucanase domain-containing protein [Rhodocollybia butyracea]|uniref:Glucanase n=1 Tax=Rhodocollybia butyracea TaxID=206335 RepID=A0A9P5TXL3_9AGAR|nr:concanavalin A-like lectin/glucanase domain-containing protein [Rhodocollybia butyracea]
MLSPNSTQVLCDQAGCDFNSYRLGDTSFYGPELTVDTTQPFTIVTQVIQNLETNVNGITAMNQIDETFCTQETTAFAETNTFDQKGEFSAMTSAMNTGMVLVLSLWDDYAVNMLWLPH